MEPQEVCTSGWPALHAASVIAPADCSETCTGSRKVIDFCIVSNSIHPFFTLTSVEVPWNPHCGLKGCLEMCPTKTFVRKFVEPLPLPMQTFHENWKKLHDNHKKAHINAAAVKAHILLANHSVANIAPNLRRVSFRHMPSKGPVADTKR